MVNVATGFLHRFAVSSSSETRTPVDAATRARTQVTGLVAAAVAAVGAPGILRSLPSAALAGIVMAAVVRLAEITGVVRV